MRRAYFSSILIFIKGLKICGALSSTKLHFPKICTYTALNIDNTSVKMYKVSENEYYYYKNTCIQSYSHEEFIPTSYYILLLHIQCQRNCCLIAILKYFTQTLWGIL